MVIQLACRLGKKLLFKPPLPILNNRHQCWCSFCYQCFIKMLSHRLKNPTQTTHVWIHLANSWNPWPYRFLHFISWAVYISSPFLHLFSSIKFLEFKNRHTECLKTRRWCLKDISQLYLSCTNVCLFFNLTVIPEFITQVNIALENLSRNTIHLFDDNQFVDISKKVYDTIHDIRCSVMMIRVRLLIAMFVTN